MEKNKRQMEQMDRDALSRMILSFLRERGAWAFRVHGSPLLNEGIPDILACYRGKFLALEVNRTDRRLSKLRKIELVRLFRAGGVSAVVYSVADVQRLLDKIAEHCSS